MIVLSDVALGEICKLVLQNKVLLLLLYSYLHQNRHRNIPLHKTAGQNVIPQATAGVGVGRVGRNTHRLKERKKEKKFIDKNLSSTSKTIHNNTCTSKTILNISTSKTIHNNTCTSKTILNISTSKTIHN